MESLKHPGTILASIDLVAIITTWVYLSGQIADLKKKIECLEKDCEKNDESMKKDVKIQLDLLFKQTDEMTKHLNLVGKQMSEFANNINYINNKINLQEEKIKDLTKLLKKKNNKNKNNDSDSDCNSDQEEIEEPKPKKVVKNVKSNNFMNSQIKDTETTYKFDGKSYVPYKALDNLVPKNKSKNNKVSDSDSDSNSDSEKNNKIDDVDLVVSMAKKNNLKSKHK